MMYLTEIVVTVSYTNKHCCMTVAYSRFSWGESQTVFSKNGSGYWNTSN